MQEQARMMAAWARAGAEGQSCVLATVVATRGSSYRSPGARMLVLPDGSRIGAISGGCLEGEVCRRAHWWTSQAPAVLKTFDTSTREDNYGFGLGCGGAIDLFLERLPPPAAGAPASDPKMHPLLAREAVHASRQPCAISVVVKTHATARLRVGARFHPASVAAHSESALLLHQCGATGHSFTSQLREGEEAGCDVFVESLLPPLQLLVCGAGMDAEPLVAQAEALGWSVVVLDRRPDLARSARFAQAARVLAIRHRQEMDTLTLDDRTAAIVMSHSFAQDSFFLEALTAAPLRYLGVLGSRRRTLDLLAQLGRDGMPPNMYAPAGLDIGAETPEQIALSILGEIQACFAQRRGGALRDRNGSIHGREDGHRDRHDEDADASRAWRSGDCTLL